MWNSIRRTSSPIFLAGAVALLCACESTRSDYDPGEIDRGHLAYVPESGQREIEDARGTLGEYREQLAAAKRDRAEVKSLESLAEQDLEVIAERVEEARQQVEHSRKFENNEAYSEAQDQLNKATEARVFAKSKKKYYEDMSDFAVARLELLEARIDLAEGRVDMAKAKAISELDRPIAREVKVEEYRERVKVLENEVDHRSIEARVARHRVELTADLVAETRKEVPASYRLNEIQLLDQVFEAKAFDELGVRERQNQTGDGRGMTERGAEGTAESVAPIRTGENGERNDEGRSERRDMPRDRENERDANRNDNRDSNQNDIRNERR